MAEDGGNKEKIGSGVEGKSAKEDEGRARSAEKVSVSALGVQHMRNQRANFFPTSPF